MYDDNTSKITMAQLLMDSLAPLMREHETKAAVLLLQKVSTNVHTASAGETDDASGRLSTITEGVAVQSITNADVFALPDGSMITRSTNLAIVPSDVIEEVVNKLERDLMRVGRGVLSILKEKQDADAAEDDSTGRPTILSGQAAADLLRRLSERAGVSVERLNTGAGRQAAMDLLRSIIEKGRKAADDTNKSE